MNIDKTLEYFGTLINKRLELHGHEFSSEDNIRFDFFHALTRVNEIDPWEIILEAPYPLEILKLTNNGSEIDLMVKPTGKLSGLICEFKYDRKANSTVNKTNRYGKLINDVLRLSLLKNYSPNYNSFLVYLSDEQMLNYSSGFYVNQLVDEEYELTSEIILNLQKSSREQINPIFLTPFIYNKLVAKCKLIFKKDIHSKAKNSVIFVWKINSILKQ